MEKVVEIKSCKHCNISFEITNKDLEFYEKVSPVFSGEKYSIPSPSLCSECRHIRRLSHRNEFNYYNNECKSCNKNIVSVYSQDKNYSIYCQQCWWGDKWDGLSFKKEFNFNIGFFEQYSKLLDKVPRISMINDNGINSENSEYCYNFSYGKNNYLVTTAWHSEDSIYCQYGAYFKNIVDSNLIWNSQESYECMGTGNINKCFYLIDSSDCNKCFLGIDLKGSSDCFCCVGLVNKKYYIFNKKYTKEDYKNEIKKINTGNYLVLSDIKDKFYKFSLKYPRKATYQTNCINSIGDRLFNCKNVYGFNIFNGENCKFYWGGADTPLNSYDILIGGKHELGYESIVPDLSYKLCFTNHCGESKYTLYSDNCYSCQNLFGCTGLKNKSYCILNKQYTKEEYNIVVPKIIEYMKKTGEWGEFFPSSISPFGYNETVAQEYFPLSPPLSSGHLPLAGEKTTNPPPAREGLGEGLRFNWSTYTPPLPKVSKSIPADKLPQNISDIPDDILNWAIECEVTNKPFKIIKPELEFYRKHNLPIPKRHPNQRHLDRMKLRNPRKLFDRDCDKCGISMKTTYSPEREEIVYCEECYNKEVY